MKPQQIDTFSEDKKQAIISRFGSASDLRYITQCLGTIVFQANGCVWGTQPEVFSFILQINKHGCTNLPDT